MTISFKGKDLDAKRQIQIWALMKRNDAEFIPPLKTRTGLVQNSANG